MGLCILLLLTCPSNRGIWVREEGPGAKDLVYRGRSRPDLLTKEAMKSARIMSADEIHKDLSGR
jgi:hypothetical protein